MKLLILIISLTNCFLLINCQSITLGNIKISWTFGKNQTDFVVESALEQSLNLKNAWLGFGFNTQPKMNSANVIICKSTSTASSIENYYNGFYYPALLVSTNPTIGLRNSKIEIQNNSLVCSFTRDNLASGVDNFYVLSEQSRYYLIAAYGSIASSGGLNIHNARYASSQMIDFTQNNTIPASSTKKPSVIESFFTMIKNWFLNLFRW